MHAVPLLWGAMHTGDPSTRGAEHPCKFKASLGTTCLLPAKQSCNVLYVSPSICRYWHPSRGGEWLPTDSPLKTEGSAIQSPSKKGAGGRQHRVRSSVSLEIVTWSVSGPDAIGNALQRAEAEVRPAGSEEGAWTSLEVSLAQQHLSAWTAGQLSFLQDECCAARVTV